mmetsp:Transcript_44027/g.86914  ORF Transcript_44027/g.86914 Transcript_44027/m.86914 type:complete len:200 (-) Transcript_44027:252-851(-)
MLAQPEDPRTFPCSGRSIGCRFQESRSTHLRSWPNTAYTGLHPLPLASTWRFRRSLRPRPCTQQQLHPPRRLLALMQLGSAQRSLLRVQLWDLPQLEPPPFPNLLPPQRQQGQVMKLQQVRCLQVLFPSPPLLFLLLPHPPMTHSGERCCTPRSPSPPQRRRHRNTSVCSSSESFERGQTTGAAWSSGCRERGPPHSRK